MNLSEYDDQKYAESRTSVSRGGYPIRRMAIAGTIAPLPESLVLTKDSHFGSIQLTQPQVVMLDAETLHRLGQSMDDDEAHVLRVAARNPFITSVVVVTDALARAYWSPDVERSGDPDMWAEAFRLDPKNINTPKELFRLAAEPFGTQFQSSVALKDGDVIPMMLKGSAKFPDSYDALSLLSKLEAVSEAGSYLLRSDMLLRDRYIHNGEVVKLSNPRFIGKEIECVMSSPCKLRTNKNMVALIGREEFSSEICDMSYSKGDGLKATIKSVGKGAFFSRFIEKESAYMTTKVYLGGSKYIMNEKRPRRTSREVPLDVTLAALGES